MSGKLNSSISGVLALMAVLNIRVTPLHAQSIEEKAEVCAGCHGADGKPVDKTIPAIWGQQAGYIYIELRDFKRGDRKNDIMQPIASSMERDDMQAIAEYFSKKTWPDLGQPRASKEISDRASHANRSVGCTGCHLRSEEHTSELQSHVNLVCRLLLEKKNIILSSHMSTKHKKMKYNRTN